MKLTRRHIESMAEAIRETDADDFTLETTADGKLRFSALEIVSRERPLSLTKAAAAKAKADRDGRREGVPV